MAFVIYQTEDGRVPVWEYYDAVGLTPAVGMALKLTGGKLVMATGTEKPQFVSMRTQKNVVVDGDPQIPVIHVNDGVTLEVPCADTVAVGDAVSVGPDGLTAIAGEGAGVVVGHGDAGFVRVRFK